MHMLIAYSSASLVRRLIQVVEVGDEKVLKTSSEVRFKRKNEVGEMIK